MAHPSTPTELFKDLVIACLAATSAYFVPVLIVLAFHLSLTRLGEEMVGVVMAFLPGGLAAYLLFRKLRSHFGIRAARRTSIVFLAFAPVSMPVAIVLAPFPGGEADLLLGSPFGFVGAFLGIIAMMTALTFGPSLLTLWLSSRGDRAN